MKRKPTMRGFLPYVIAIAIGAVGGFNIARFSVYLLVRITSEKLPLFLI